MKIAFIISSLIFIFNTIVIICNRLPLVIIQNYKIQDTFCLFLIITLIPVTIVISTAFGFFKIIDKVYK